MREPVLRVQNLCKRYGDVVAVENLSFTVEEGTLFALLGVNGAGKSTTINILCSILPKEGGSVVVDGVDLDAAPAAVKEKTGIVFQGSVLDDRLTVRDNLLCRAALYGFAQAECKRRVAAVSETLELGEILARPYGKLSGGQRRRVDIARALLNRPRILFLDEPTTGLDPATRQKVWGAIDALRGAGMTIFLTTHYMEETAGADQVVILNRGKIVAEGTPDALKNRYAFDTLRLICPQTAQTEAVLAAAGQVFSYRNGYNLRIANGGAALDFLNAHRAQFPDFEIRKGSMDDVFLNATGEELV
ncbi:MAG: ABC transporter ATP-binding protein [Oscillospiraceae bacterium]|jgi:ABC-type multidrug transport system ATPase subunit|nr:ABC transporter ATP-binding protein [Oscillospiraceae bacterium]